MKVTRVCCQGCGADLQVDETIRFVTCNYCGAKLEVVHGTSVTHTKQLDKIERTTDLLASNLKVIELQNEIERLDREWDRDSEGLMVRDQAGRLREPNPASMIGGCFFTMVLCLIILGVFGMALGSSEGSVGMPPALPLLGLVIITVAILGVMRRLSKVDKFRAGRAAYRTRRAALIAQLEAERGG